VPHGHWLIRTEPFETRSTCFPQGDFSDIASSLPHGPDELPDTHRGYALAHRDSNVRNRWAPNHQSL